MFGWFTFLCCGWLLLATSKIALATSFAETRLFIGHQATPYGNPYMVAIIKDLNEFQRCGGALISDEYVLTAAQCVVGYLVDVVLGAHDIISYESHKQTFRITERNKFIHPEYNASTMLNNIALLKLPQKVKLSKLIQTIKPAPEDSELFIGENAIFMGWGLAGLFHRPSKLQQVVLTVVGNNNCKKFRPVELTELCATTTGFWKVGIKGDAGSPLILRRNNEDLLIAIASAKSSIFPIGPTVFTRVSSFRKWIDAFLMKSVSTINSSTNTLPTTAFTLSTSTEEPTTAFTLSTSRKEPTTTKKGPEDN